VTLHPEREDVVARVLEETGGWGCDVAIECPGSPAAIEQAVRVISSDTAEEAQAGADRVSALLETMVQGEDVDGDGAIAPTPGEGGILTAYEHALNMGTFEFFPEGAQAEPAPAPTEPAPDEDEEPAEATATPEPEAVVVNMLDFEYDPGDLTVPAGTTVTFVNQGEAQHSATLGDGSLDTGLFDPGEEASLTLDTPGTFVVYCTLHGTPDGGGMSMSVTVTD
jgi:plastocyanin